MLRAAHFHVRGAGEVAAVVNEGRQAGEGGWQRCWPGPTLCLAMHTSRSTSRHFHGLHHPSNAHVRTPESWRAGTADRSRCGPSPAPCGTSTCSDRGQRPPAGRGPAGQPGCAGATWLAWAEPAGIGSKPCRGRAQVSDAAGGPGTAPLPAASTSPPAPRRPN